MRCPVLPELEGTVCGERAVWATLVAHPRHGRQLLRAQLLLVHHRHVRLHLALVGKPVSTQPATNTLLFQKHASTSSFLFSFVTNQQTDNTGCTYSTAPHCSRALSVTSPESQKSIYNGPVLKSSSVVFREQIAFSKRRIFQGSKSARFLRIANQDNRRNSSVSVNWKFIWFSESTLEI